MVGLRTLLVIFLTLLCREVAGALPRPELVTALISTSGIIVGAGLLFRSFAIVALCQPTRTRAQLLCQLSRHRSLTDWTWCILLPFALLATGWGAWLREWEQSGWLSLVFPGYFLPTLCVILLIELTFAEFEQTIDEQAGRMRAGTDSPRSDRWQRFVTRLKLGELASLLTCVFPALVIMFCRDLVEVAWRWFQPDAAPSPTLSMFLAAILTFSLMALFYPLWMSKLVGAVDLGDRACGRLAAYGSMANLSPAARVGNLLGSLGIAGLVPKLIPSRGRWSGAAVVGWFPACRHLWLGDRLIKDLTREELDMVVLHELAHIKRKHFTWRMLPIAAIALIMVAAWLTGSGDFEREAVAAGVTQSVSSLLLWGIICTALLLSIGWIARKCELDADRTACQLAAAHCEWTQANRQTAAHLLASALVKVHDSSTAKGSWLHPGLHRRLHNLGIEQD
jgi:hypothetical protein